MLRNDSLDSVSAGLGLCLAGTEGSGVRAHIESDRGCVWQRRQQRESGCSDEAEPPVCLKLFMEKEDAKLY